MVASEITDFLKEKGIKIIIGNSAENIKKDFDLVVHSPAVKHDNPEYKKAKELGIKMQSYPEALGRINKRILYNCSCWSSWKKYNNCNDCFGFGKSRT